MTGPAEAGDGPVAGVIGTPIAHSLSPVIHGYWLEMAGLPGRYVKREIPVESFAADFRRLLTIEGWVGMNVTVPHKEAAFAACDRLDDAARRLGAVNTVIRHEDGVIEGRNTDLYGFRASLEASPDWPQVRTGTAFVLGAGGAARAVVAALQDVGFADIQIVNRNPARAEALARDLMDGTWGGLSARARDGLEQSLGDCDLLVNTTSLGMEGQPPLDIDLRRLPETTLVADIVYRPLETGLLATARARGNPVVDGLGMLLHQAVPGFQAWFKPPVAPTVDAELRRRVLDAAGIEDTAR
ncbi:MAG: shikimate dehydrogenase [Alphaproteobacteria bacterium]